MSSAMDVCEGCRRLRKRCDKDNCVLHPCLESLWPSSRQAQGNATVFLAKYFGRKRFFKLLEAVNSQQRAGASLDSLWTQQCVGIVVFPLMTAQTYLESHSFTGLGWGVRRNFCLRENMKHQEVKFTWMVESEQGYDQFGRRWIFVTDLKLQDSFIYTLVC